MLVDLTMEPTISWKDMLIGKSSTIPGKVIAPIGIEVEDDFELLEGDTEKSFVNVEYEFLPMVCFGCGRYGHVNEACLNRVFRPSVERETLPSRSSPMDLVMANEMGAENSVKKAEGSRFHALIFLNKDMGDSSDEYKILGNNNIKGKEILVGSPQGTAFNSRNLGLIERGGSKWSS
ncbi:hypothetical protein Gotur_034978 [Gossypium turneri]